MKDRCAQKAIAVIGAVIGAGFASGREVMTFFCAYGAHSWWLILLTAAACVAFCMLCMRATGERGACCWYALYDGERPITRGLARLCALLVITVVSGAMVAASGHIVSLLWASDWAYPVGALGTLILAWQLGYAKTLKLLSLISWALTALLLLAVLLALRLEPEQTAISAIAPVGLGTLALALLRALGYAAMNITIAISVVCGCAGRSRRDMCRTSVLFGLMLTGLLFVSNHLYLKHPALLGEAFPVVRLLSGFGRAGFIGSAVLLYLALLTTLVALIGALRGAVTSYRLSKLASTAVTLVLPLGLSRIGFSQIVADWYAPVGLLCALFVLLPLFRARKRKKPLTSKVG